MTASDPLRRVSALFTKRPVAGAVKTRLVGELSASEAARLQEGMLEDAVARLRSGAERWRSVLAFAPETERAWFAERFGELELVAQAGAGLGERLATFFARSLEEASSVVVTGSDQPLLPAGALDRAHGLLAGSADLVLAPDLGGGYALVGLARPAPKLFLDVAMSTSGMFDATVALARAEGLELALLDPVLDVDDAADLEHLVTELARAPYPAFTEATRRALEELGRLDPPDPLIAP